MKNFELPEAFIAHLEVEVAELSRKNDAFAKAFEDLRAVYGGGTRVMEALAAVVASDEALRLRLMTTRWGDLGARIEKILEEALARVGRGESGEEPLELYWSLEHPEVHRRSRDSKAVPAWRRRALVTFDEIFRDLLIPARSSAAYPIIFTHEVDENHRAIVTAVLVGLITSVLADMLDKGRFEASSMRFRIGPSGPLVLSWEGGKLEERRFVAAKTLGFGPEGELERLLGNYVDHDPRAHLVAHRRRCDEGRRSLGVEGIDEVVDLVDPAGRALRFELDLEAQIVTVRRRESSELVRKRTHLFVDPSPVQVETLRPDEGAIEDARNVESIFERHLTSSVEAGYRIVYHGLRSPASSWHWGEALIWD